MGVTRVASRVCRNRLKFLHDRLPSQHGHWPLHRPEPKRWPVNRNACKRPEIHPDQAILGDEATPEPITVAERLLLLIIVKLRSSLHPGSWLPWNHSVPQEDVCVRGKREGRMNLGKCCITDFPHSLLPIHSESLEFLP